MAKKLADRHLSLTKLSNREGRGAEIAFAALDNARQGARVRPIVSNLLMHARAGVSMHAMFAVCVRFVSRVVNHCAWCPLVSVPYV